jgi:preprotein translocase subunit YajC
MAPPVLEPEPGLNMPLLLISLFTPSGQQGGGGMSVFIFQIALFVGIFYFLLIRPQRAQQKKHQALLASLQRGDQVVTSGGVIGEVVHIKDNEVTIKSAESRLVIARSSVSSITNRTAVPEVKQIPDKGTKPA